MIQIETENTYAEDEALAILRQVADDLKSEPLYDDGGIFGHGVDVTAAFSQRLRKGRPAVLPRERYT